ncbi:MAG: type II toxin-antitoxin system VapC family toxin [Undibacterium sp.]|nr:type II toxin-antitoxin system VapC family toxin [Opitutaceae bacterium]
MSAYFDTSVLMRWYILETGSKAAVALRTRYAPPIPLSPFHRVELTAACRLKVFRRGLGNMAATQAIMDFQSEVEAGLFEAVELSTSALCKRAEFLADSYPDQLGVRSLDIWHVATALELKCREFITADARQGELAKACRLKVISL